MQASPSYEDVKTRNPFANTTARGGVTHLVDSKNIRDASRDFEWRKPYDKEAFTRGAEQFNPNPKTISPVS